jgi:hypothetical protein
MVGEHSEGYFLSNIDGNMIFGLVLHHLSHTFPRSIICIVPPFIYFVRLDWSGSLHLGYAEDGCDH